MFASFTKTSLRSFARSTGLALTTLTDLRGRFLLLLLLLLVALVRQHNRTRNAVRLAPLAPITRSKGRSSTATRCAVDETKRQRQALFLPLSRLKRQGSLVPRTPASLTPQQQQQENALATHSAHTGTGSPYNTEAE